MKTAFRKPTAAPRVRAVLLMMLLAGVVPPAQAGFVTESGDAGQLPGAAQLVSPAGAVDAIRGTLTFAVDDIDLYRLYIPDLFAFSATTVSPNTELFDTRLFLFDDQGRPVAANDDTQVEGPPFEFHATLGTGKLPGGPGEYLLAVAVFNVEPLDGSANPLFPQLFQTVGTDANGDPVIIGPRDGDVVLPFVDRSPLGGWTSSDPILRDDVPYRYEILLTGAEGIDAPVSAVPAPGSLALVLIGGAGLVPWLRRRAARPVAA